jgi:hypothetical protein
MSRDGAPDFSDDPRRFAGLEQRRRERGLPTGRITRSQAIGDSLVDQGWTAEPGDEPGETIFRPPPGERF